MPVRVRASTRNRQATAIKSQRKRTRGNNAGRPQPIVISHQDLIPKGSFAKAGGMLGGLFGPKGAMLGSGAGAMLSRITGVGDYTVKSNSIMTDTATYSGEVPAFGKTDNSTRVRHREFVMDVTMDATPAAFRNTSYVIQPSNAALFPWLSSLAKNYQQYRLHGCVFVFKSTTSDYSAAGALGKVAMATNYNVRDSAFLNMQELENAEFSVSGKPSLSRVHPIECAANNGVPLVKWVRDALYDQSGGDDRLYDVGKFQFATSGLPIGTANAVIGELWVSYDIEFYKPIIGRTPTSEVQYEPVSVPVFDSFAGGAVDGDNTTNMFMMEGTYAEKPSGGWTDRAAMIRAFRKPGSYIRAPGTFVGPGGSARLTRSVYRDLPDPASDSNGSYPAYWKNESELVLQRKGVYVLRHYGQLVQGTTGARNIGSVAFNTNVNSAIVPASATASQKELMARIQLDGPASSYVVYYRRVPSAALTYGQPNNVYESTGARDLQTYFTTTIDWEMVVWVKQDNPGGDGVTVRMFDEVQNASDRSNDIGMQWEGAGTPFNMNNIDWFGFETSFLSTSTETYYRPVTAGLTNDDKANLKNSIGTVEALMPKLRELGLF